MDIVAEIETAIKRLPFPEKENIRYECAKLIESEKSNKIRIDRKQAESLKKLKEKDVFFISK
jgi:hypothetical protein